MGVRTLVPEAAGEAIHGAIVDRLPGPREAHYDVVFEGPAVERLGGGRRPMALHTSSWTRLLILPFYLRTGSEGDDTSDPSALRMYRFPGIHG